MVARCSAISSGTNIVTAHFIHTIVHHGYIVTDIATIPIRVVVRGGSVTQTVTTGTVVGVGRVVASEERHNRALGAAFPTAGGVGVGHLGGNVLPAQTVFEVLKCSVT